MSATQHEYYIRQPSDTDARGPFTLSQIADLASSGGIDDETLYYDANADEWRNVKKSSDLSLVALNAAPAATARSDSANAGPPCKCSTRATALLLFASSLALLIPTLMASGTLNAQTILRHPYVWIGALDLVLGVLVLLFSTRLFRVVRIFAGLSLGFLGVLFWLQANYLALACALIASLCIVMATLVSTKRALIATATAGLAALGILAYCLLS